jgi:septal ring factor EnvC (AmiA/AmiB activator)
MPTQKSWFKRHCIAVLLVFVPVLPGVADPPLEQSSDQQQKLINLREQITALKKNIDNDYNKRNELNSQLEQIDKQVASSTIKIQELTNTLKRNQRQLGQLETKQARLSHHLIIHQQQLSDHIRAAYQIGQQEYLKLLLNQQDPSAVARTLVYYRYFNEARMSGINTLKSNLQEIDTLKKATQQELEHLEATRLEQQKEKAVYQDAQKNRNLMVAKLNEEIRLKGTQLQQLEENEANLKGLLETIQDHFQSPPPPPVTTSAKPQNFVQLKGKLFWPTRGKITARYGSKRNIGNLRWKGVLIQNETGGAVYAVAAGTVVFADWLRGFGLLIIIDHGMGYMTLYGHNESLGKQLGDTVQTSELIAQVGNSGGQKSSGLYFEIRFNGKPVNPSNWCSKQPELAITSNTPNG